MASPVGNRPTTIERLEAAVTGGVEAAKEILSAAAEDAAVYLDVAERAAAASRALKTVQGVVRDAAADVGEALSRAAQPRQEDPDARLYSDLL
jgi:hypothetical protein